MTMPNSQCPQCSALLPPGAPKCAYCGYTTPWGAVLAQQNQRAGMLQADQEKRQGLAKALNGARNGMIIALVGLPICCGPLSLVGGIMGWRAGSAAKAQGGERPITSVIALFVALLSMSLTTLGTVLYIRDQRAKAEHLAAVGERLQGKREAEVLEPKVACDLIEEHLTAHGFADKQFGLKEVHCDGAFSPSGRRASQADVRFAFDDKHYTATACLEKRSRWFVVKVGEGLSCADLPPPAAFTPPPRKLSDEELAADEEKARKDIGLAVSTAAVKAFTDKLAKVRADAAAAPTAESTCAKATMAKYVTGDTRKKVPTVDIDLLDKAATGKTPWGMLTTESVRKILDEKGEMNDRAAALTDLTAESGDLIVVYKPIEKLWPVVRGTSTSSKDFSFDGGEYTGTLLVYDLGTATRLCAAPLAFESSEVVDFKKSRFSSAKSSAKEAVEDDFRDRFANAATKALKRAAPDLRLGYLLGE